MMRKGILSKAALIGGALLVTIGCGKTKSDTDETAAETVVPTEDQAVTASTESLQLSGQLTILPAQKTTSLALEDREVSFPLAGTREVRLRVNNEAFEAVDQAASIMCFLEQTKFWMQANNGIYKALVDNKKCEKSSGASGGDPQQQGNQNQAPELDVAYVRSSRVEGKGLIGEFRVEAGGEESSDSWFHVKVIVISQPSAKEPAGIFSMEFTEQTAAGKAGQYGFIRTRSAPGNKFVLEIGMAGSESSGKEHNLRGTAELEAISESVVVGHVRSEMSGKFPEGSFAATYKSRFDEKYLNVDGKSTFTSTRGNNEEEIKGCFDLKKFKTAIYRYDLLDAAGKTVELNSGFSVEVEKGGKIHNGWMGYHGLWADGQTVATGDTIYKVAFANGGTKTRTPYTVFAAPGKLTKLTKTSTTLGALKGLDLNFYESGSNYVVRWDGTTLTKMAKVKYGSKGMEEEAASGEVTIPQWGAGLWVPSLNANIQLSKTMTLSDALVLSYHSEEPVSGTANVPTCSLVCFNNCPVMAPTLAAFKRSQNSSGAGPAASSLYKTTTVTWEKAYTSNQVNTIATPLATYTWDSTTQNLKEGTTAFALPSGMPTDQSVQQEYDNLWSGALVCSDVYAALTDKTIDPYRLQNEAAVYYRFASGAQDWNRFLSLKDSTGAFVKFDKPLQLSYTHTQANDWDGQSDASVIGKSYNLNYNGPGQLHGIPWKYAKNVGREMPLFSIKDGTKLGDYTIVALDGEQRLAKTETTNCASLSLDQLPELPTVEMVNIDHGKTFGDDNTVVLYIGGVGVNK